MDYNDMQNGLPGQQANVSYPYPAYVPSQSSVPASAGQGSVPGGGKKATKMVLIALGLVFLVMFGMFSYAMLSISGSIRELITPPARRVTAPNGSFSVIPVVGTIQSGGGGTMGIGEPNYLHADTVAYIEALAQNGGDKGILLYMNTGGGGVYESDEVYRALEAYKEETGRPVWAYMASYCASGGYYICMAADMLMANYNTTTGSIGVYIALADSSRMYEGMGIETVLVRSGENKGIGVEGTAITEENRAVYQSIVDESYERFISLVMAGRGMDENTARRLGDGRPYTAQQALKNGLVDELGNWEKALSAFAEQTGGSAFIPSFSRRTPLGGLLSEVDDMLPRSDAEMIFEKIENMPTGVPMAYAPGLAW